MGTLITIVVIVGFLAVLGLLLVGFAYPDVLGRMMKAVFVRPFKGIGRSRHQAAAVVKPAEIKADTVQPK